MIHPTYLPFSAEELKEHFTGDRDRNVKYFTESVARYEEFLGKGGGQRSLVKARGPRQIEKDERFWTASALMALVRHSDAVERLEELLVSVFGPAPPLESLSTWEDALSGGGITLLLEPQLPSPEPYTRWLSENLTSQHMIPYVLEAGRASRRRLEGATHVDGMILNQSNGFAVLFEAKVLSDISNAVSFDCYRNQIVRNVDVMLASQSDQPPPVCKRDPARSLFALLTPRAFKQRPHSRLYGWLCQEYRMDPTALGRDLPHREEAELDGVGSRIGWLTFEDISESVPGACPWIA